MEKREKQVYASYLRVQAFLNANPATAPASYAEPKAVLDDVIARLGGHRTVQESGRRLSRGEQTRLEALMQQLRTRHLRPIVSVARAYSAEHPGILENLVMPKPRLEALDLVKAAEAMRDLAQSYQDVFVKNGRPADFIAQLTAAIDAVNAAAVGRGAIIGQRVGARKAIQQQLARGRRAVGMLDAIIQVAFEGKADMLGAWQNAKRVKLSPGAVRFETVPTAVPTEPTTQPSLQLATEAKAVA